MKKRYTEEQIIKAIKDHEAGVMIPTANIGQLTNIQFLLQTAQG